MTSFVSVVAAVKMSLERRGASLVGACGAARITWRVAWILRDQPEGWGLVAKVAPQTGCDAPDGKRYAADTIISRAGQVVDILIYGGGVNDAPGTGNEPAWQVNPGRLAPELWRPPFDPEALSFEQMPGIAPAPSPPAAPDAPVAPASSAVLIEALRSLGAIVDLNTAITQALILRLETLEKNGLRVRL